jgi:hypothetical protein
VPSATAPRRTPWRQRTVTAPAVLTVLTCTLLGTVGWYFQGAAIAYNCGMSDIGCGTTAKLWLAADGIGVWILAMTAAILPIASRGRPRWRRPAAITCWILLPAAVSWFLLAGRLT